MFLLNSFLSDDFHTSLISLQSKVKNRKYQATDWLN